MKKNKFNIVILIIIVLLICSIFAININYQKQSTNNLENKLEKIQNSYSKYVLTTKETNLYDSDKNKVGTISNNMYLELDELNEAETSEYFKLKNSNLYIKYTDIEKSNIQESNKDRYKNYIPFDKSIITDKNTKLHVDENTYYIIDTNENLPIIIDETDRYYTIFDNKLVYVSKENANVIDYKNSTMDKAEKISVLNYHFVINKEAGEDKLCEPSSICHFDTQFDSHMKYINENSFYTITLEELEMFIDGKINLPKKSVSITIDDGWFVGRAIQILEKYDVMGTLFLIGSLAPVSDYASDNLEVHSHTWDLHNVSNCSGGRSPLLCYDKNTILEDLKKSRESLNNTTYFCYPFYEYNNYTIEILKEAGFTMALAGPSGDNKAKVGTNKFSVPRYVIYNTTTVETLASMINN